MAEAYFKKTVIFPLTYVSDQKPIEKSICFNISKNYFKDAPPCHSVDILRNLGTLAEDENMLKRVAKYLRKLVAEKHEDPTLISKEEFFASLDRGEEEYRQGKTHRINSKEELNHFLNSL